MISYKKTKDDHITLYLNKSFLSKYFFYFLVILFYYFFWFKLATYCNNKNINSQQFLENY